jgi:hypothetical protein
MFTEQDQKGYAFSIAQAEYSFGIDPASYERDAFSQRGIAS